MRKHERAYVNIGPGRRVLDAQQNVIGIALTATNYGRTPAVLKKVTWGIVPENQWPIERYPPFQIYEDILNPGMEKGNDQFLGGVNAWSRIGGTDTYIFYARIIYTDVFGREHFASSKHRILPDAQRTSIALAGSYSEGWDYNRRQKPTDPP